MKLIDIYTQLRQLNIPSLQTQDVSAILNINVAHASKILSRLADAKLVIRITRGTWIFPEVEPLALPEMLTSPFPAYVSLQTALFYHGMISQIPSIIYAISLARTRFFKTSIASVSIHHVQPIFFFGYEEKDNNLIKMATPEKALIDILYLSPTKSRLFHTLPEFEFTKEFNHSLAGQIIQKIPSPRTRTLVEKRFQALQEQTKY